MFPVIVKRRSANLAPTFTTTQSYRAGLADLDGWWPYVLRIVERHRLDLEWEEVETGLGGTFPTLVCGDFVVKFFGHLPFWPRAHDAEMAAMRCVVDDPGILAPRLLFKGRLFEDSAAPWPYLVTTRMPGLPWDATPLSTEKKTAIAADLGRQVRRISAIRLRADVATPDTWHAPGPVAAARQSALPPHLVSQINDYIAGTAEGNRVFVHGDLMFRHVFVEDGRLAGVIDWGDALVADRHYELAQIQLNLFDGDKTLLRTFLDHSDWPVERDFARRALTEAFRRQAVGLAQHRTMDVFHKLPQMLELEDVATLDDLAEALFGV